MEKESGLGVLCRVLDEREEVVVDRERNVCDPIRSVGSVSVSKERLWQCNLQGNDIFLSGAQTIILLPKESL